MYNWIHEASGSRRSTKKAKSDILNDLDESSAFWFQDFAQKVLPVKFREGQHEYFGKRGMSLHVDVFFVKKDYI